MRHLAQIFPYYYNTGESLPDDVYAAYGTDFDDLLLPEGQTWQEGDYDPLTEGTYAIASSEGGAVNVILEKFAVKLEPANLYTMLQEISGEDAISEVDTDGQPIGMIYDLATGAVVTGSSGTAPVLSSSSAFSTLIKKLSTTLILQMAGYGPKYLMPLHAVNPIWSIQFVWRFETGSDGVQTIMFFNNPLTGTTATDAGIHVRKTTGDKIQIIIYKKVSGQPMVNFTTATTVNVASGVIWVTINVNGTGATAGVIHIKTESGTDTSETFTVNAGNAVTASGNNLQILVGSNQSLGAFRIRPRISTAEEITAWKTYNPARYSTPFLVKSRDYNLSIAANVFSDASGTVQITDGGFIRYVKDSAPTPFGELPEYTSADDASAPVWNDNGGVSYGQMSAAQNITIVGKLTPEGCGRFTLFLVISNEDLDFGSHLLSGGNSSEVYMVLTGENYTGNPGVEKPYLVIHPDNAINGVPQEPIGSIPAFTGDNFFCWIRNLSSNKLINNNMTDFLDDVNSDDWVATNSGTNAKSTPPVPDWNYDGRQYRIIKYAGAMSEARALAIRDELKTFYGIA